MGRSVKSEGVLVTSVLTFNYTFPATDFVDVQQFICNEFDSKARILASRSLSFFASTNNPVGLPLDLILINCMWPVGITMR